MAMHVRERNNDRLFEVENADCPPSLSKHGVLRSGQKSELLSCVEVDCPSDFDEADAKLIDRAHMAHFLMLDASIKSFRDYADKKVIPYIERQLANTKIVYVIWDRNLPDSLKSTTRQRRGTGIRQRMRHDGNWTFPRNWNSYLQNVSNKVELFHFHASIHCSDRLLWRKGCNINSGWKCIGKSYARWWWVWISAKAMQPWGVRYESDVACSECSIARLIISAYWL